MKVGIYARVSTDEQNIQQQKNLLVKWCKDNNHIYRSYIDEGVSGQISDRPQWQRLLRDVEKKKIDAILVVKADRITRSLKYAIEFYNWAQENKTELISLFDNINLDSPDGYFTFMLKCLLSEYELLQLKWRSRIGIERAKKEGKYRGGKKGRTWTRKK